MDRARREPPGSLRSPRYRNRYRPPARDRGPSAHRLLKTDAAAAVGHAYALITEEALTRFDVPTEGSVPIVETYEHFAPVRAHVFPLRAER